MSMLRAEPYIIYLDFFTQLPAMLNFNSLNEPSSSLLLHDNNHYNYNRPLKLLRDNLR